MHNAFVRSIADMLVEFLRVDLNSSMRNNNTLKTKKNEWVRKYDDEDVDDRVHRYSEGL